MYLLIVLLVISLIAHFLQYIKLHTIGEDLRLATQREKNYVPTVGQEILDKEFTLNHSETAIVEGLQITQKAPLIPSIKSSGPNQKSGVRVAFREGGSVIWHDFELKKDNTAEVGSYIVTLVSYTPGSGTFKVSKK
jgi:hypothetical protein